jgi:hypothetical protein
MTMSLLRRAALMLVSLSFGLMVLVPAPFDAALTSRGHHLLSGRAPVVVLRLGRSEAHRDPAIQHRLIHAAPFDGAAVLPADPGRDVTPRSFRPVSTYPPHWAARHLTI